MFALSAQADRMSAIRIPVVVVGSGAEFCSERSIADNEV